MGDPPKIDGGITPHIMILDGRGSEAVAFYEKAFGAKLAFSQMADDGKRFLHAHPSLNGGSLLMHDDFPEFRGHAPAGPIGGTVLHLEVDDADTSWKQALAAGASIKFDIADQFWGARYGQVTDPFGHTWSIGSPIK